jgi:hypothetical protein
MSAKRQPKDQNNAKSGWRDKPVEQEADKEIKEGGVAGTRRELGKQARSRIQVALLQPSDRGATPPKNRLREAISMEKVLM